MNPKDFSWDEAQQVIVTNPTAETYRFKVHSKDYAVEAGETVKMPGFIAWVYVYGLASKIAQEEGKFIHWNEEGFRSTFYSRLVVGEEDLIQKIVEEPKVERFEAEPTVTPAVVAPVKKAASGSPKKN